MSAAIVSRFLGLNKRSSAYFDVRRREVAQDARNPRQERRLLAGGSRRQPQGSWRAVFLKETKVVSGMKKVRRLSLLYVAGMDSRRVSGTSTCSH